MTAAQPDPAPARRGERHARSRAAPGSEGVSSASAPPAETEEEEAPPAPWHFKVLLLGTAGYLIYRLIWVIFWLTGHAWHG